MTSFRLVFGVKLAPALAPEEGDLFATSYLTSDVSATPAIAQTDVFGSRLSMKKKDDKSGVLCFTHSFTVAVPGVAGPDGVLWTPGPLGADAAYCVQCFCEVPNHKDERCSHRCGFAAFSLRAMAETIAESSAGGGAMRRRFWVKLRDHGPSPHDARGRACVFVRDPDALVGYVKASCYSPPPASPLLSLVGAPTDAGPKDAYEISSDYYHAVDREIFDKLSPTDPMIRVPKLPIYTLSGGMTMPSCAFIRFVTPPYAPDEFYVNAFAVALRRNFPFVESDAARERLFCQESENAGEWNRKASILMDAATLLAVSFPYLYDSGISTDGKELEAADEFVRTGRITYALDCEDGAVETLVFLWHVLADASPVTRVLAMARRVRMQYVVTLCLKAVTRPSQSGDDESKSSTRSLAAHACCDMIPLYAMRRMIRDGENAAGARAAIDAIIEERKATLLPEKIASGLRVAVGETTGYIQPYIGPTGAGCSPGTVGPTGAGYPEGTVGMSRELRKELRGAIAQYIPSSVRTVSMEDVSVDSSFYRYAVSALVHDTATSSSWPMPQIVYVATKKGATEPTYGAPHADYVRLGPGEAGGSSSIGVLAVSPVPAKVMATIAELAKFEHPVPPLSAPSLSTPEASKIADRILRAVAHAGQKTTKKTTKVVQRTRLTLCAPLHEFDATKIDDLAKALRERVAPKCTRTAVFVEPITEFLATVVFIFEADE